MNQTDEILRLKAQASRMRSYMKELRKQLQAANSALEAEKAKNTTAAVDNNKMMTRIAELEKEHAAAKSNLEMAQHERDAVLLENRNLRDRIAVQTRSYCRTSIYMRKLL